MANGNGSTTRLITVVLGIIAAIVTSVSLTYGITQGRATKSVDKVETAQVATQANVSANNIRISVLENKWDTVQASLLELKVTTKSATDEIKALLIAHMKDTR
jgi:hypothetical protein